MGRFEVRDVVVGVAGAFPLHLLPVRAIEDFTASVRDP